MSWESKIIHWCNTHGVDAIQYHKRVLASGAYRELAVAIVCKNNVLQCKVTISQKSRIEPQYPKYSEIPLDIPNRSTSDYLYTHSAGTWNYIPLSMSQDRDIATLIASIASTNTYSPEDIYEVVYYQLENLSNQIIVDKNLVNKKMVAFAKEYGQQINEQLAQPFYKDVDLAAYIKLVDDQGKVLYEDTKKTNYAKKVNDIKLNITLHIDGSVDINHIVQDSYLEQYEKQWIEEAKNRGVEINIKELRQELIDYLSSSEVEQQYKAAFLDSKSKWYDGIVKAYTYITQPNLYAKGVEAFNNLKGNIDEAYRNLIQSQQYAKGVKAYNDLKEAYNKLMQSQQVTKGINAYLEAVQSTQKITKNIWAEGVVPQSIWYSKDPQYKQWPNYVQMKPLVGGATDGVIDEIVGLPMACKTVVELATDKEKRQAFGKLFTSEGFTTMCQGIKQEAKEVANDKDKQFYYGAVAAVSVVAMLFGTGFLSKAGKADEFAEVAEQVSKKVDALPDGKYYDFVDATKKAGRTAELEKIGKELIEQYGEEAIQEAVPELLDLEKDAAKVGKKYTWQEVKAFFERGNAYNKKVQGLRPPKYGFHEVTIEDPSKVYPSGHIYEGKPVRYRLDSYTPGKYIVSRKATDFDKIKEATFEGYCKELVNKYKLGAKIVATAKEIKDTKLSGALKLEVPKTNEASNKLAAFKKIADKYKIEIIFEPEF